MTDSGGKAELFATTFQSKFKLAEEQETEFSMITARGGDDPCMLRLLTVEDAEKVLAKLDEHSATSPDTLPTRILKKMAGVLAFPFLLLAQSIITIGRLA